VKNNIFNEFKTRKNAKKQNSQKIIVIKE